MMKGGISTLAAATAILAIMAGPAGAQQANANTGSQTESGVTRGTQDGQSQSRSITRERSVESSVTIQAAQVILPALATPELPPGTLAAVWPWIDPDNEILYSLFVPPDREDEARTLIVQKAPVAVERACQFAASIQPPPAAVHPERYSFAAPQEFGPRHVQTGDYVIFARREVRAEDMVMFIRVDEATSQGIRPTLISDHDGKPRKSGREIVPWNHEDLNKHSIPLARYRGLDPEPANLLRVVKAEERSILQAHFSEVAPLLCIQALTAQRVTANVHAWPQGRDSKKVAAADTTANIVVLELAQRIAQQMQAVSYREPAVARALAQHYARTLAPAAVARWTALHQQQGRYQISVNMIDCPRGWTASLPSGESFAFCGSPSGYQISQAASAWGGAGWLAGTLPLIEYAETGAATMQEAVTAATSTELSWGQRIRAMIGVGN